MMNLLQSRLPWADVRGIAVSPAICYQGEVAAVGRNITAANPFYSWWWLLEGEVRVEAAGEVFRVPAGRWILIPWGTRRHQQFSPGSRIISINFSASWATGVPLLVLPRPILRVGEEALKVLAQAVSAASGGDGERNHASLYRREISIGQSLDLTAALARFIKALFLEATETGEGRISEPVVSDGRLEQVLWHLQTSLQAGPLPFPRWEEQTGLSRSQLDRLSRELLGTSLHRYRDRILTAEACRRLAAQVQVKQVAQDLGFVDTAHFCRWVRRHTGHTPAEIRLGHF